MKITKKELLEKVAERLVPRMDGQHDLSPGVQVGALAAAKALGYEVVEAPELPERLQLGTRHDDGVDSPRALRDAATQPNDDPRRWAIARNDRMAAELVLRYNAKAAVLKVAEEMERDYPAPVDPRLPSAIFDLARRLRAAYGASDE